MCPIIYDCHSLDDEVSVTELLCPQLLSWMPSANPFDFIEYTQPGIFKFEIKGKVGHLSASTKLRLEVAAPTVSVAESDSEVAKTARKLQSCSSPISITASTMTN